MFVCTLPSPACMCSATNTRLRSTCACDVVESLHHRREREPREDLLQRRLQLALPRHDDRVVLQRRKRRRRCGRAGPASVLRVAATSSRASSTFASTISCAGRVSLSGAHACVEQRTREERRELVAEPQLVADRQLDVDALDAVGVVAEARQRDDHVLVDLERVGVPGDGRGARAVEPEFLARFGRHRDEAFGAARVGDAHDFGRGLRDGIVVVADDVAQQHHLRPPVALGLGRVADRLHVALVEVLEARQHHARAAALGQRVEIVLDLDDRGRRVAHLPEEFEADGADRRRHRVQDEARAGDEPVAAFLLDARQPRQELVGDVLAEARLAKRRAGNGQRLACA